MISALLVAAQLAFAAPTADAAKPYKIAVDGTTTELKAGAPGLFKLSIRPATGFHVSPEAPLKIGLEGHGVELEKKSLGHGDAQDKNSQAPQFAVKFAAAAAGAQSIAVDATFFVCSEKLCERKSEKLNVPITVKP